MTIAPQRAVSSGQVFLTHGMEGCPSGWPWEKRVFPYSRSVCDRSVCLSARRLNYTHAHWTQGISRATPFNLETKAETKTHKPPLVTRTEQQQQLVVSDQVGMATGGGNTVWTWKKRKTLVTNVSASNTTSGDGTQTSDCVSVVI